MVNNKVVVVYSGGMDSFTLLHEQIVLGEEVYAISFNYGQRHIKELDYARAECERLKIPHTIVDVSDIGDQLMGGSSQTDLNVSVPEGHYADENMKLTVVPNRNMVMLSLAIAYAISIDAKKVSFGAHAGDHAIYPDCRPAFVSAMNNVAAIANYSPVEIEARYLYITKGQIAAIGKGLGVNYGRAWTCYKGWEKACGKCGACQERIEAMAFAGIDDPMEYE